jgi:hypothetical protein
MGARGGPTWHCWRHDAWRCGWWLRSRCRQARGGRRALGMPVSGGNGGTPAGGWRGSAGPPPRCAGSAAASSRARATSTRGLPGGQALGAWTSQRSAAPAPVAGRPPLGGLDGRRREPLATTQISATGLGVERVVWGRAAVEGVPGPHGPADHGPQCLGPAVGAPVPRTEAFDHDDPIRPKGCHGREPCLRPGVPRARRQDLTVLAEDPSVQAARMPSLAVRRVGRWGGASPAVASASASCRSPTPSLTPQ